MRSQRSIKLLFTTSLLIGSALVMAGILLVSRAAAAPGASTEGQASPLHPAVILLDDQGRNVLDSGAPVSTMRTCGGCHDSAFIQEHSYHAAQGLDDLHPAGELTSGRPWDISPGLFGRWNPFGYRVLSSSGDEVFDLGTAAWIQTYGPRHVGGGPAYYARDGVTPLTELPVLPGDPETHVLDPESGRIVEWDWEQSGVVEMNCFLCHLDSPDNEARVQTLHEGAFGWANTATLQGMGIVTQDQGTFVWSPEAFNEAGEVRPDLFQIQDPGNENCGLCHGLVHDDLAQPLTLGGCNPESLRTVTTGQIISPQRLADTGVNLENKENLSRAWDVHAERLVECTDCHYSLNNPVYYQESDDSRPGYLSFDPRRLELGEYLYQPLHQFARGQTAQNSVAPELRDTMRACDGCHTIDQSHTWLPYKQAHVEALTCETCHIPAMYSNALMSYDWTVLTTQHSGLNSCRGLEGDPESNRALVTGFEPLLLLRHEIDGDEKLAPFNLVTTFYWVEGERPQPVRLMDLEAAWFEGEAYAGEVMDKFDLNADGELSRAELILDTPEKVALIASRLRAAGVQNPRIAGEIQPYSINHTVATGDWAIRDCAVCHTDGSRIGQSFQLTAYTPGGVTPVFAPGGNVSMNGSLIPAEDGTLIYQPETQEDGLYILGSSAVRAVDLFGGYAFLGVLAAIVVHGGLRVYSGARRKTKQVAGKPVYMYGFYERLWHWLQTLTIVGLLFTGLIIHKPATFAIFSFRYVVLIHNILAGILALNAFLALFYHLASGEIRQYLPQPRGFFAQAFEQASYYLRGIFRGEAHPFEKIPEKKLNPLQQVTYFAILNVLLPLQGLTGLLMWGAQAWPDLAARVGGLPFLAPFHTLIAWLFAAFIVMHVYLTTTGPTPTSSIKAMLLGWEEVEGRDLHGSIEEAEA